MIPYYVLIGLPCFFLFFKFGSFNKKQLNKIALSIFFIILYFMIALRHIKIGNDTSNYKNIFLNHNNLPLSAITNYDEPGYFLFNKFIGLFTTNYQVYLSICALITLLPIAILYIKETDYPLVAILIFINMSTFCMMFSGIRQSIAFSLGVLSYSFVKKKKLIPFLLCVLIAFTIHKSAFMILFLYPMYHLNLTKKWILPIVVIIGVVYIFHAPIFNFLLKLLPEDYSSSGVQETGAIMSFILFSVFMIYGFTLTQDTKDKETIGLRNILVLATILQIFALMNNVAMRMNYYFIIFIPLAMSKFMKSCDKNLKSLLELSQIVIVVFFFAYFFYTSYQAVGDPVIAGRGLNIKPYHFYWEILS